MADTDLKTAITEAFNKPADVAVDDKTPPVDDKAPVEDKKPPVEPDKKDDEDEDNIVEFDASPEELRNALSLFRSVGNPETRKAALEQIARAAGIKLETKADEKKLVTDINGILKETLGDSYELLSGDKLALAFEKIVKGEVDKVVNPLLEKLSQREQVDIQQKADGALADLWKRKEITDPKKREEISGLMTKKMKSLPPGDGISANEYLDDIFALVSSGDNEARKVRDKMTRIRTNAKETDRVSGDGGVEDKRVKTGSKVPSLNESIAAAFRGERLEE